MHNKNYGGAWGQLPTSSAEFVRRMRGYPASYCPVTKIKNCRTPGQCQYCGEGVIETERLEPGDMIFKLLEGCETLSDLYGWQQAWRD